MSRRVEFGPLVSADWLAGHLDEVRVVDVRWYLDGRSGRAAYLGGHLPGAIWMDVDTDLSAPASPEAGRHPLPSPGHFAQVLGRAGIAAGTPVVAYDDTGGSTAARLWWMLRVLDEPAAVLDGGIAAWSGPLETGELAPVPVPRTARPWPVERFVDADDVLAGRAVYDARTTQRYAHGDPAIDPRPGHVPGAFSAPWAANLDEVSGRLRPPDELRQRYADAAARGAVAYCGSGVTACLNLLAMEVAGIEDIALYPGSWSQWGADPSRPIEES